MLRIFAVQMRNLIDVNNGDDPDDEKSGRIFVCFAVSNEVDSCTLAGVSISLSSSLKNEKMILNVVQYFFGKIHNE